ncbi:MAG: GNAT family N-acetyltransferase [Bacilli bacterium]|nr:GNAT family N-acetyltransferase [Bacilli bacterium]
MLRKATLRDVDKLDDLAVCVIQHMIEAKIPQWTLAYPRSEHFKKDILVDGLYVFEESNEILASCTILPENDPAYTTIHSWIKQKSLVIHRILVHPDHQNQGIAIKFIEMAKALAKAQGMESIKIDTHRENYKMRRFLAKNGFIELDYLVVIDRIAYELVLEEL